MSTRSPLRTNDWLAVTNPASALAMLALWLAAAHMGGLFIVPPMSTSLLWMPAGLSLAVVLRTPKRSWGWPAAVMVLGQWTSGTVLGQREWTLSLAWGLANLATVFAAALLLEQALRLRGRSPRLNFEDTAHAPMLLGASLFGALPGALMAGVGLFAFGPALSFEWPQVLTWWSGDALGLFLIAPLLLAPARSWAAGQDRVLAVLVLVSVAIAAAVGLLGNVPSFYMALLPSLAVPTQIMLAMKAGARGAALVAPLLVVIGGVPAVLGQGPFEARDISPQERFAVMQSFLAMSHLAALLFAAALAQRERATRRQALLVQVGDALIGSLVARRALQAALDRLVPSLADEILVWRPDGVDAEMMQTPSPGPGLFEQVEPRHLEAQTACRVDGENVARLFLPLLGSEERFGTMALGWKDRVPDPEDLQLAEAVAARVSVALENARLYERTTEAVAAREEFISIAAHELRTPLTSLQLRLQSMLRDETLDVRARERTVKARDQTTRLSRLVDLLLDVSRANLGEVLLQRQEVSLAALAQDVVERFADQCHQVGSAVNLEVRGHPVGFFDRLRIEQVLTNLLSNALKFGGGLPLDVVVEEIDGDARLVVSDRGPGLSETMRSKLFQRFERGVSPSHFGGLGLGLYLSRRIVEAHGGRINALPSNGAGATFVVTLPLSRVAPRSDEVVEARP